MRRKAFLTATSAGTLAATVPALAATGVTSAAAASDASDPFQLSKRVGRTALVLSGGGALGAYEAGIVGALAYRNGLSDGQPLPYDLVCGTSVGALNGYCVATAQYSRLRWAWDTIARMNVIRVKPKYRKLRVQSAGVANRLYEALGLGLGVFKNVRGVLDNEAVAEFMETFCQPSDPVHLPFYFASTNLTRLRGEIFIRRATTPAGLALQALNDQILTQYKFATMRVVGDDLIRTALFASAAIPLAFDPIEIESPEKTMDVYVDGGVTYNVPVAIARRCAERLQVVLVDPAGKSEPGDYDNAVEVGLGVFETMQRSILEYQVRVAYLESFAMQVLSGSSVTATAAGANAFLSRVPLVVDVLRPSTALPGTMLSFNDPALIGAMWQRGWDDGIAGFAPYRPPNLFV